MLKIKNLSLLMLTLSLTACNNPSTSSPISEPNSDTSIESNENNSSSTSEFVDETKTDPVYDGSDVLVSKVVTNENGTHIEVDGKPFLFVGTQIRVDAFMNCDKLSYDEVKCLFAEASKLGVTCVQIPIEWAKMELEQDVFDYTYIRNMLLFANEYNLKVEFLWFGTNMCGDTHSYTVPDYILRDGKTYPKFDALRTGEFWNYYGIMWFLDFDNENLVARESNAISKMMDYIYDFDSTHGGKKTVIGIQVLNEPDIFVRWRINDKEVLSKETGEVMSHEEGYQKICNSLDALGKTVKNSKYKVYTRVNLASSTNADNTSSGNGIFSGSTLKDAPSFATRFQALEGIDIIGDDSYTSSVKNIKGITAMYATKIPNNFGHIAENDGNYKNTPSLILASVAMHGGYSIYDLLTSPFFVSNNASNIDQGVIKFKEGSYTEYTYKAHYDLTQNIIEGLKLVGGTVYDVKPEDFAAFNIKYDNPSETITQNINTTNVALEFSTTKGAIGYAIDHGTYMDVYVTENSTLKVDNIVISAINTGEYGADGFVSATNETVSNTIELAADTLYRVTYASSGKLSSSTWDNIGG